MRESTRDHIAEVTIVGTATAQFTLLAVAAPPGSLAVLSLDPQAAAGGPGAASGADGDGGARPPLPSVRG